MGYVVQALAQFQASLLDNLSDILDWFSNKSLCIVTYAVELFTYMYQTNLKNGMKYERAVYIYNFKISFKQESFFWTYFFTSFKYSEWL